MYKRILSSLAVALSALSSVSCGTSNSASPTDGGTGGNVGLAGATPLPCDVDAVVVEHCQSCHGAVTQNAAPMSLVTWEDFQRATPVDNQATSSPMGAHIWQAAEERIHDTKSPMPQPPNAALTASELATMDAWLNGGTPKGTTTCNIDASVPTVYPSITCNKDNVTLTPASAWTMPTADDDDYVCYSVSIPTADAGTNHVLSITPNIVNTKIVHHVLLFQADPSDTSITSTPAKCAAFGSVSWRIVYGWAPGGGPMTTPPGVGFPFTAGTKWVVQVHYNNINHLTGETDTSGFSFCSTNQPVQYDADVIAFGTQNITIPPLSTLNEVASLTIPKLYDGIHLFAAFPHMHVLGSGIETEQVTPSGGIIPLGRNAPWNFNAQLWYPVDTVLHEGDVVNTRCEWQNSTSAQVTYGSNTENEMCYSFTAYYPLVNNALSWALPAISASVSTFPDAGTQLPVPDAGWTAPLDDGGASFPSDDAGAD